MSRILHIIVCIFVLSHCSFHSYGHSQKDSVTAVLGQLNKQQKAHSITDSAYRNRVHDLMRYCWSTNIFFTNKELLILLDRYRQVIWKDETNLKDKRIYYSILSNQAQMTGRSGEMLYYGERIGKMERELNNRPSLTSLSVLTGFYGDQGSSEKIRELYVTDRRYFKSLPDDAAQKKLSLEDMVQATMVLQRFATAYYEIHDSLTGDSILALMPEISNIASQHPETGHDVMGVIRYSIVQAAYDRAVSTGRADEEYRAIRNIAQFAADPNTPAYLHNSTSAYIADISLNYYLKNYNKDSVKRYLQAYIKSTQGEELTYSKYMAKKYQARSLYKEGKYKECADNLIVALGVLDTARSVLVKDIGDMVYARAEADEQQLLLADAEAAKREAEIRLLIAGIVIAVVLVTGVFIISYIRRKQKERFTEFKLNMARNIHDETGPVLLYAKALAKTKLPSDTATDTKTELEKHIDHTIEIIRSLSHDLKSDHLNTVNDLAQEIERVLKKLGPAYQFTYDIQVHDIGKSFLSHRQFTELKSILLECVSNTIKHASFDKIDISFGHEGKKLLIAYSDNGIGWQRAEDETIAGIGLKNMEERSEKLQGSFGVKSNHPQGYKIEISVPLR